MTITVAQRSRVLLRTSSTGVAQRITLPASGILVFAGNASVPSGPTSAPFIQLPAPWNASTDAPGIRLIIHNFSVTTPIQPTLLNADGSTFYGAMSLVEPGGGHTSLGITNETVPGLPASALKLALANVVVGDTAGFNVEVLAWAV